MKKVLAAFLLSAISTSAFAGYLELSGDNVANRPKVEELSCIRGEKTVIHKNVLHDDEATSYMIFQKMDGTLVRYLITAPSVADIEERKKEVGIAESAVPKCNPYGSASVVYFE